MKQRRIVGDIVEIDLGQGYHTYARVLDEASFAFYDARTPEAMSLDAVLSRPVLFVVAVMDYAVKKGRWPVVGHIALENPLKKLPPKFMQDALNPASFSIYENGAIRRASREECLGLERQAVWDPEHVEERLRDHYEGRTNRWVKSLEMI